MSKYECWIKIINQSINNAGKINCVSHIRILLFKFGFGYAFIAQDIGNPLLFLKEFKQRLIDCNKQNWLSDVQESSKLRTYSTFKTLLEPEKYLHCIILWKYRKALCKFRCSNHDLNIEIGRRFKIPIADRICIFCINVSNITIIEDEYHFLCICKLYQNIRNKYVNYLNNISREKFIKIMSTKDNICLIEIAMYIYYAMYKRKQSIN